jgi:zinc transporter ZupT
MMLDDGSTARSVESLTPHPQEHPHDHVHVESGDYSPLHDEPELEQHLPEQGKNGQAVDIAPTDEESGPSYFPGQYKVSSEVLRMDSRTTLFPCKGKGRQYSRTSSSRSNVSNRCQEGEGGASGTGVAGLNATLGLVIHAMADGIALGSSSLSSSGGLGFVVFLAVIVQKGESELDIRTRTRQATDCKSTAKVRLHSA